MKKAFFILISLSILTVSAALAQAPAGSSVAQAKTDATRDAEPLKGYVFGPGDEITVRVISEPDYDFGATVDENGNIEVPFLETPMVAQCKTERQLREDIQKGRQFY